jgi:hypothetical protein
MANAMLQRLLLMVVDMTDLEVRVEAIQKKLKTLSTLEQSEFKRRLRAVLNSKSSKLKFIKNHNSIQHAYEATKKERAKTEFKFILIIGACILINYFFNVLNENQLQIPIFIFGLMVVTYEIKKEIFDSKYFLICKEFEFNIDRCTNDIAQYGTFEVNDSDLFHNFDNVSEPFKSHFYEVAQKAQANLQIEILKCMNLEVELENDN